MIFIPTDNTRSLIDILAIDNEEHNHINVQPINSSYFYFHNVKEMYRGSAYDVDYRNPKLSSI